MALLPESTIYEAGIYQLETTDPALAGVNGIMNTPGKQLANRTNYLKSIADAHGLVSGAVSFTGNLNALTSPAWYYCSGAATNMPSGQTAGLLRIIPAAAGGGIQMFHSTTEDSTYTRRFSDAPVFQAWARMATYTEIQAQNSELVGMVSAFGFESAPTNWLKCNGASISRASYATLFAKTGVTWGVGDGTTTFDLPDFRGEFLRGYDDGRGVDVGRVFASEQSELVGIHNHPGSYSTDVDTGEPRERGTEFTSGNSLWALDGTGFSTGTENRPRNVAINFFIKYQ